MPELPQNTNEVGAKRRAVWCKRYLQSTRDSLVRAKCFHGKEDPDHFTAYIYLFVAFNNVYSWYDWINPPPRARKPPSEPDRIKRAVQSLLKPDAAQQIYTATGYFDCIVNLNKRRPAQLGENEFPEAHGILRMAEYFRGVSEPLRLVSCLEGGSIASLTDEATKQRDTLAELAAGLLYSVRNNQFHSQKGVQNFDDDEVLKTAYALLFPISDALLDAFVCDDG